jgi:hypothetical protein
MYTTHAVPGNLVCSAESTDDKFRFLCKKLIVAHHSPPRTETSHEEFQAEVPVSYPVLELGTSQYKLQMLQFGQQLSERDCSTALLKLLWHGT